MRRVVFAFLTLYVCLSAVEAQAQATLGLKAGLNLANVSASEPDGTDIDLDGHNTFGGGAYFQLGLGDVFALQTEALYTPRGAKRKDEDATLDLSYIDVPLLFLVRVPAGDASIQPILYAGPVVSFETECRLKSEGGTSLDCGSQTENLFRTRSPDFSGAIGGGFEVFMGLYTLQLDIRYTLGFVNIDDTSGGLAGSAKNRTWSFYIGLGRVLVP